MVHRLVLVCSVGALVVLSLSSCGITRRLLQTPGRMIQAVQRTLVVEAETPGVPEGAANDVVTRVALLVRE